MHRVNRLFPLLSARSLSYAHQLSVSQARTFFGFSKALGGDKKKTLSGRPALEPGKVSPPLPVPDHIMRPPYAESGILPKWSERHQIHDEEGKRGMRAAGALAARVLAYAGTLVRPGVTTDSIDRAVHAMIIENNAYPSPLNYGRFPKSVCTSINECVCHGIPDDRELKEGDIVNLDVTVYLNGYHGDTSKTFFVGEVSPEARKLVETTEQSLAAAIAICGPGVPYKQIGSAISNVAERHRYSIVREYIGHGVGAVFHSHPSIVHYRNSRVGVMQVGETFTIEPMLCQGSNKCRTWEDEWTVVLDDGGLTAQCEHTLLITDDGVEVLTKLADGDDANK